MLKIIARELKSHAPFTFFGALTGIMAMLIIVLGKVPSEISCRIFYVLHPVHVVLSALATTAMYRLHKGKILPAIIIGYTGSVGIATLSDIVSPYMGGILLGAKMELHFGFIEKWWLVNPLALLGVAIAILKPATKFSHSGHVLLSTWASLFYLAAFGEANWISFLLPVSLILFVAVWIPCCVSDIVFPLFFAKEK